MEKYTYDGEDFKAVFNSDNWKIGLLKHSQRFSKLCVFERHLKTDEVFVLLMGEASLFVKDEKGNIEEKLPFRQYPCGIQ